MFKHLTNFAYNRTALQAFGFYLAYLIGTVLLGGLLGGILAASFPGMVGGNEFEFGIKVGGITATVVCVVLSGLIVQRKQLTGNVGYLVLVLVAGGLAYIAGGLFGLLPVAFLTTRKAKK